MRYQLPHLKSVRCAMKRRWALSLVFQICLRIVRQSCSLIRCESTKWGYSHGISLSYRHYFGTKKVGLVDVQDF